MPRRILETIASRCLALAVVLGAAGATNAAMTEDAKTPYPNMAPVEQYRMERNAEIALARSAAPESISRDAGVMVLGQHGYETAVHGNNGFVCLVEREEKVSERKRCQACKPATSVEWVSIWSHAMCGVGRRLRLQGRGAIDHVIARGNEPGPPLSTRTRTES